MDILLIIGIVCIVGAVLLSPQWRWNNVIAGIILFSIWVSLCVVIIGGWAFKTLDDDVIPNWDDEIDEFDDAEEQGNLL